MIGFTRDGRHVILRDSRDGDALGLVTLEGAGGERTIRVRGTRAFVAFEEEIWVVAGERPALLRFGTDGEARGAVHPLPEGASLVAAPFGDPSALWLGPESGVEIRLVDGALVTTTLQGAASCRVPLSIGRRLEVQGGALVLCGPEGELRLPAAGDFTTAQAIAASALLDERVVALLVEREGIQTLLVVGARDGVIQHRVPVSEVRAARFCERRGHAILLQGERRLTIVDLRFGKTLKSWEEPRRVFDFAVDPNGRHLVVLRPGETDEPETFYGGYREVLGAPKRGRPAGQSGGESALPTVGGDEGASNDGEREASPEEETRAEAGADETKAGGDGEAAAGDVDKAGDEQDPSAATGRRLIPPIGARFGGGAARPAPALPRPRLAIPTATGERGTEGDPPERLRPPVLGGAGAQPERLRPPVLGGAGAPPERLRPPVLGGGSSPTGEGPRIPPPAPSRAGPRPFLRTASTAAAPPPPAPDEDAPAPTETPAATSETESPGPAEPKPAAPPRRPFIPPHRPVGSTGPRPATPAVAARPSRATEPPPESAPSEESAAARPTGDAPAEAETDAPAEAKRDEIPATGEHATTAPAAAPPRRGPRARRPLPPIPTGAPPPAATDPGFFDGDRRVTTVGDEDPLPDAADLLVEDIARALGDPGARVLLVGPTGSGRRAVLQAAARRTGKRLAVVDASRFAGARGARELREALRRAADQGFTPCITCFEVLQHDPICSTLLQDVITTYTGPITFRARPSATPPAGDRGARRFALPVPRVARRAAMWREALAQRALDPEAATALAAWPVGPAAMARVASSAASDPRRDPTAAIEVMRAGRLAGIASLAPAPQATVPEATPAVVMDALRVIAARAREAASDDDAARPGPIALFEGPRGSGRSTAAALLAGLLGWPRYRTSAAALLDGGVAMAMPRLAALAEAAGAGRMLIHVDGLATADAETPRGRAALALLGRSLPLLGAAVVLEAEADEPAPPLLARAASMRVSFPLPGPVERARLLATLLPPDVDVSAIADEELGLAALRRLVENAALLAAAESAPLDASHLDRALALERAAPL